MLKPAREPDHKQLMLCKGARGLKTSCEPVRSQSSARDHWTIAGHLGFDCERESAFNDVEKARAFTLASQCYTNGMLSTHMQCSLVQHSHAVLITVECINLYCAYLTLRQRSSTRSIPVNVAVYLGSCLCIVVTGAPQAAVATAKAVRRLGCR